MRAVIGFSKVFRIDGSDAVSLISRRVTRLVAVAQFAFGFEPETHVVARRAAGGDPFVIGSDTDVLVSRAVRCDDANRLSLLTVRFGFNRCGLRGRFPWTCGHDALLALDVD